MKYIFIFISFFFFSMSIAQLSKTWQPNTFSYERTKVQVDLSDYYDLTKSLPTNHVKDGSVDYTEYIMAGIRKYSKVIMPNFPILTTGIGLKSNSSIYFSEKSKLILKANAKERYQILAVHGVENVKIYHPKLIGDRKYHIGSKGEWGFGLDIRQAKNIDVYNAEVSNCWGDGIIITESPLGNPNKKFKTSNINIYNSILDFNRRNGLTITGGENILIQGALITNTFGTAPQSGLDIEPDNHLALLNKIKIYDVKINNADKGLTIVLNKFLNKNIYKSVSIDVQNLVVTNSTYGILIQKFDQKDLANNPVTGNISIKNFKSSNTISKIYKKSNHNLFPNLNINGVKY